MRLATALRVAAGDVVAFVGGGGKTTAMFRLAEELTAAGGRVITTTTTRIFAAQIELAPRHLVADEVSSAQLADLLEQSAQLLVTGTVDPASGKAFGVAPEVVEAWADLPGRPTVLIEADGSRMQPFKAPAEHEPVIPARTSLVVPVVGADVFGAALGPERVHRFERVQALTGWLPGSPVTPELVARVLLHPDAGLKDVPNSARVVPLINKVETAAALAQARETAARLLAEPRISAVAIGAARQDSPVAEVWGRVAAIVLAAGRATRMGQVKQMLPWGQGQTLVTEVVRRLQACPVAPIVVVTGMAHAEVEAALDPLRQPDAPEVRTVFNPDYATTEMGRSLQVGLRALPANCLAALVALADQPALEPNVVAAVVQRWRESQSPVAAPFYRGRRGHPLLFDRAAWPRLLGLPAGANPREALEAAGPLEQVEVDSDSILRDIDTPEDYAREMDVRSRTSGGGKA